MSFLGRLTIVSLVAAAAAGGACRDARASELEGHVEPGVLISDGFPAFKMRPTVGIDATRWWSPARHLDLGLETGVGLTSLPYGDNDGEPIVGKSGGESVTFLPRVMFGSRAFLLPQTWGGLFVGTTALVSPALGEFSVIPYPTASVAVETRFGARDGYGVRAAVSYMHFWFESGNGLLMSTLAFTWGG